MKIIDHHPEEGNLWEDPNLRSLLEHSDNLLSEDYRFESPFRDSMGPTSEVDPYDFDLNVDEIGLKDDFDLSKELTGFVSMIRDEDAGYCESVCKRKCKSDDKNEKKCKCKRKNRCRCHPWLLIFIFFLAALIPFAVIAIMWWNSSRTYHDIECAGGILVHADSNRVVSDNTNTNYNLFFLVIHDGDSTTLTDSMQFNQHRYYKNGGLRTGFGACGKASSKIVTYDWLLILFGIILSLALIAILIVLIYHIRKKDELEHEDCRLFFEHQNKMINEYASYLYSIKRVRIQQCEALLSLKQQHALQQLDFQQREMDMRQKEQDNAWKHKENHLNAVKEHLSNLHFEANPDKKPDTKEEKQSTNQQHNK